MACMEEAPLRAAKATVELTLEYHSHILHNLRVTLLRVHIVHGYGMFKGMMHHLLASPLPLPQSVNHSLHGGSHLMNPLDPHRSLDSSLVTKRYLLHRKSEALLLSSLLPLVRGARERVKPLIDGQTTGAVRYCIIRSLLYLPPVPRSEGFNPGTIVAFELSAQSTNNSLSSTVTLH